MIKCIDYHKFVQILQIPKQGCFGQKKNFFSSENHKNGKSGSKNCPFHPKNSKSGLFKSGMILQDNNYRDWEVASHRKKILKLDHLGRNCPVRVKIPKLGVVTPRKTIQGKKFNKLEHLGKRLTQGENPEIELFW